MSHPVSSLAGQRNVDVIISGGGPTGISLAYLLGRLGVRVVLFEQRLSTSPLPKGQFVHASTGELFRQWGIWDDLKNAGWHPARSNGQGYYIRVCEGPVATVPLAAEPAAYEQKWSALSPAFPRKIPASDYEAAIRRAAENWAAT